MPRPFPNSIAPCRIKQRTQGFGIALGQQYCDGIHPNSHWFAPICTYLQLPLQAVEFPHNACGGRFLTP